MYNVEHLASADRADVAVLLRGLAPEQWQTPSLCAGWTVRDVITHVLSYEEMDRLGPASRCARAWFTLDRPSALGLGFDRANNFGLAAYADHDPPALLELLDRSARPRETTSWFGGRIALLDGMIRQQDVRRPLGVPCTISAERPVRETGPDGQALQATHPQHAPPRAVQRPLRSHQRPGPAAVPAVGLSRVLTRCTYGFRSPQALIAMAMLTRGGVCPDLPGRS